MEEKSFSKKFELNNESLENFEDIMGLKLNEIEELKIFRFTQKR